MARRKDLVSIGELSRITKVSVKSLRRYSDLGILPPEHVDEESGYRYYDVRQRALVDAIRLCVGNGIPLAQFKSYVNFETRSVDYGGLVESALAQVQDRLERARRDEESLCAMREAVLCAERLCSSNVPIVRTMPERTCWTVPFGGASFDEEAHALARRAMQELVEAGLNLGNTYGLLLMRAHERKGAVSGGGGSMRRGANSPVDDAWSRFVFVDVREREAAERFEQVVSIEEGSYLCHVAESSGIMQALDWSAAHVEPEDIELVVEAELFSSLYRFERPVLEQRCLLRANKR